MLSENIRKYRKSRQMSQDELAEKLEVTRQSISLWETGQTQPSLDNIVALAKLFDISTDALLTGNVPEAADGEVTKLTAEKTKRKKSIIFIVIACLVVVLAFIIVGFSWKKEIFKSDENSMDEAFALTEQTVVNDEKEPIHSGEEQNQALNDNESTQDKEEKQPDAEKKKADEENSKVAETPKEDKSIAGKEEKQPDAEKTKADEENSKVAETPKEDKSIADKEEKQPDAEKTKADEENGKATETPKEDKSTADKEEKQPNVEKTKAVDENNQTQITESTKNSAVDDKNSNEKDIYGYLKDFVVENGIIYGDYCYYSKSADTYGGYSNENFSLYYWGDTEKIEFCLHSVLDDTFSINFYLYVPKNHTGNYDYISSYYYRDNGEPLYEAKGVINAGKFTKNYPLNCNKYTGSADIQNEFMEISRQGICDLIACLEEFIDVEGIKYSFADFGFTSFR